VLFDTGCFYGEIVNGGMSQFFSNSEELGRAKGVRSIYWVSEAVEMIQHAHELGYETSANLMAVSNISEVEIDTVLEAIAPTPAQVMVIVDSFGHLYREQIDMLYKKYSQAVSSTGKDIGIHAHNNLQLAFANTIEAIIMGANRVDATMGGMRQIKGSGAYTGSFCGTRNSSCGGSSSACRIRSSRCGKNCCGDRWCPTTSPAT
jgi:hypothetical protein